MYSMGVRLYPSRIFEMDPGDGEKSTEFGDDRVFNDLRYTINSDKLHALGWKEVGGQPAGRYCTGRSVYFLRLVAYLPYNSWRGGCPKRAMFWGLDPGCPRRRFARTLATSLYESFSGRGARAPDGNRWARGILAKKHGSVPSMLILSVRSQLLLTPTLYARV